MTATPTPENLGPGHRCRNCGERIDVESATSVWVHDRTGGTRCDPAPDVGTRELIEQMTEQRDPAVPF